MKIRWNMLAMVLGVLLVCGISGRVLAQDVPRMSVEELQGKLGNPQLVVLDVRSAHDWNSSGKKIAGAHRENPGKMDWAKKYAKDSTLVLYCA